VQAQALWPNYVLLKRPRPGADIPEIVCYEKTKIDWGGLLEYTPAHGAWTPNGEPFTAAITAI